MQSNLQVSGALAEYEVSEKEVLTYTLFDELITQSKTLGVLNLDVLLETYRTDDRRFLTNFGFTWSGTYQVNRDRRALTFIRFRMCVKASSDGLATNGNTTLAPTEFEKNAVAQSHAAVKPLSAERLAQLAATGKPEDVPTVEDAAIGRMRREIATLELALETQP